MSMRILLCCLVLCVLLGLGVMPATAQFVFSGENSGFQSEHRFSSSLSDVALNAIARHNFTLASKMISLLQETSKEPRFLVSLAIAQAQAGDWNGSDRTLSFLKEPQSRATVFTDTGAILAAHNRTFEARDRFIKAFHEAVIESDPFSRRFLLDALIREEIRAGYRSMARITMGHFETEFQQAMLIYPPALMRFSRWNAEIGDIEEALRAYRRIPPEAWKDYDKSGDSLGGMGFSSYAFQSPRSAIAAAYIRAGNSEAAWNLYDSMTSSREKLETLRELTDVALQRPSNRDAKILLEKIVQAAEAVPVVNPWWPLLDLIGTLERSQFPLSPAFADLRRYHFTVEEELQFRLGLAYRLGWKHGSAAHRWLAPLPRLLSRIPDESRRVSATVQYAGALWSIGKKTEAKALLHKTTEASAHIADAGTRMAVLYSIAGRQVGWKDTTGQKRTEMLLLEELREHPGAVPPSVKISETRQQESPYGATVVLSEVLLIADENRRAQELERYISQLLWKHQLKQAIQILPLFPLSDDLRSRLKQDLNLH